MAQAEQTGWLDLQISARPQSSRATRKRSPTNARTWRTWPRCSRMGDSPRSCRSAN